jgi:hypothetical protein
MLRRLPPSRSKVRSPFHSEAAVTHVESFESLDTIAEVAVTLAGFAGLIAALAGASHQDLPPRQRIAFWLVLATSLATLILSFLPRALFNFGLSEPTSWRICCGVLALVNFATLGLVIRVHRSLLAQGISTQFATSYVVLPTPFGVFSLLALATAAGIAPLDPYALFYAGLVISLAFACLIFAQFFFMRTPGPQPPAA